MFFTHLNHVFNIEVLSVDSDGAINAGNSIAKGLSANDQTVGGQVIIGSGILRPATYVSVNVTIDPDAADQPQKQV